MTNSVSSSSRRPSSGLSQGMVGRRIATCPVTHHFQEPCQFKPIPFPTLGTKSEQEHFIQTRLLEHYQQASEGKNPRVVAPIVFEQKVKEMFLTTMNYGDVPQHEADSINQDFQNNKELIKQKQNESNQLRNEMNQALQRGEQGTLITENNYRCNSCGVQQFQENSIPVHFTACLKKHTELQEMYKKQPRSKGKSTQQEKQKGIVIQGTEEELNTLRQTMNEALQRGEKGTEISENNLRCNICAREGFKSIGSHFKTCLETNPEMANVYVPAQTKKRKRAETHQAPEQILPVYSQDAIPSISTSAQPSASKNTETPEEQVKKLKENAPQNSIWRTLLQ